MKQHLDCFKLHTDIFRIGKVNKDFIAVATYSKYIKIFSINSCQVVQNIYFDLLGKKSTAIAFHPSLDLIAIANEETIYILSITEQNISQTIKTYDGAIQQLSFMEKAPYLITGTKNGRVMQYHYKGETHISRLCSFPYTPISYKKKIKNNYISAIAHNDKYIAVSGFGAAVTILKFHSHAMKLSFEVSQAKITTITFLENSEVIFANLEGVLYISQIKEDALISQIHTQEKDISQILQIPQTPYLLIVSQSKSIMLFHLKEKRIIKKNYLHFKKEIRSVVLLNNNTLLVSLVDNSTKKISLGSAENLHQLLKEKKLLDALLLIESNPILEDTTVAKEAKRSYEKFYLQITKQLFQTGDKSIVTPLEPFTQLKAEKNTIVNLLLAHQYYPKLQLFYEEYKFPLAYALCEKYPALKTTQIYLEMEKTYKKCFTLAQKHLLLKKTDKAKEILRPFITISSKRTMIQLLLRQNKEFLAFIKAVAQKDYEQVDTLIKAYPIFKEIPSYTALQKEILLSLEDISHNIKTGNIPEAINIIRELNNIPLIKEELYQLYKLAQEAKKLLLSYEKDDFIICYEIIDKNRELESMQLVKLLEEHWEKQVQKCEIYALQGNIQAVKETLDELIYIETRKEKIGNLLRVSFQSKIKKELQNMHYKSVENFIYSYIDIFGIDSELNQIIRNYEDQSNNTLAITVLDKTHKKRNSWVYKDII